jgi:UDP:flavonoid glycosyltransferase YjiC (YdhE family)
MDSVEPLARRVRDPAASLPAAQVRHLLFAELFVRGELEPRANDLIDIVEQWAPDVVVHDVAEFAAPLVATMAGIPYVEHSYGPAIANDVIRAAGDAAAPSWSARGLAPHPLGGLYQELLLPDCAAVVTHGGAGSTLGALAFGLPLLMVPQGADHFFNAERVTAAGAGLQLLPDRLTADSARDAVRMLLHDDTFRVAARRIENELAAMPDPHHAVEALERLTGRQHLQHGS